MAFSNTNIFKTSSMIIVHEHFASACSLTMEKEMLFCTVAAGGVTLLDLVILSPHDQVCALEFGQVVYDHNAGVASPGCPGSLHNPFTFCI